MDDFIVNESNFLLEMEELRSTFLTHGQVLPCGMVVSEILEQEDLWQIYITEDSTYNILAVNKNIAKRWINEGFLPNNAFDTTFADDRGCYLLYSPSSIILGSVNQTKFYGSLRYALSFGAALLNSRRVNYSINLRDGLFCELYSVFLPSYSKNRTVADRAIFENAIGKSIEDNISSPKEMKNPGLSFNIMLEMLKDAGYNCPDITPYLRCGEPLDDFIPRATNVYICAAISLHENYQIYQTNSDSYLLVMENDFANSLCNNGLLRIMDFASIQIANKTFKTLLLSKRFALDALNDRHFGFTAVGALQFAQAVKKTRKFVKNANFVDALYCQEKEVLLPVSSSDNTNLSDSKLVEKILNEGPFASCAFFKELIDDAILIAE